MHDLDHHNCSILQQFKSRLARIELAMIRLNNVGVVPQQSLENDGCMLVVCNICRIHRLHCIVVMQGLSVIASMPYELS